MLTMSMFREERRQLSVELAGGARQVSISVDTMKREMRKLQVDFPRFLRKTLKLRIEVEDQATGRIQQIRTELEKLNNWSNTTKFAENMARALETARRMVNDFNVSVSIGGKVGNLINDTKEAARERSLYAARDKDKQEMMEFDNLTKNLLGLNPYMSTSEAMKLINQAELLQPHLREDFVTQAAQLGVSTGVDPKDLLNIMATMSQSTGVEDATRLANSIQYMHKNMKDFNANHLNTLVYYSKQTDKLLDSPEKLATLSLEMDKRTLTGDKKPADPKRVIEIAEKISKGEVKLDVGKEEAGDAYKNAIKENSFFEYQQAENQAKQAWMDLTRTVAQDVAPLLKPLIQGFGVLAEALNGFNHYVRKVLEIGGAILLFRNFIKKRNDRRKKDKGLCICSCALRGSTRISDGNSGQLTRLERHRSQRTWLGNLGNRMQNTSIARKVMGMFTPSNARRASDTPNGNSGQLTRAERHRSQRTWLGNLGNRMQNTPIARKVMGMFTPSNARRSDQSVNSFSADSPALTRNLPDKKPVKSLFRRLPIVRNLLSVADIAQSDNKIKAAARVGTEALGGWGGAAAGAAMGAMVGSIVPLVGTAVGGIVGSAFGAFSGSDIGGKLFDTVNGWWNKEPQPTQMPEPVTPPVPLGPPAPASSPASNPRQQTGPISVTIPQITVPLHAEGVLQDIPTMLKMLNDPSVGQRIKTIIEKALLDALETRGGVAT